MATLEIGKTYTLAVHHVPSRRPTIYKVTRSHSFAAGEFLAQEWVYSKKMWTKKDGTMPAAAKLVECPSPEVAA